MKIIYTFLIVIAFYSCNKEEVDPGSSNINDTSNYNLPDPSAPVDSITPFIRATFNFNEWYAKQSVNGFMQNTSNIKIFDNQNNTVDVDYVASLDQDSTQMSFNNHINGRFSVSFTGFSYNIADYSNTNAPFFSSFPIGNMNYYSTTTPNEKGAEIIYMDESNVMWTSKNGDQSGSIFSITKSENLMNSFNQPSERIAGNFTCKLYKAINPQSNEYLSITNGAFILNYDKP